MNLPEPVYKDSCPKCLEGPYEPTRTRIEGIDLVGAYTCTECGHAWRCWWNASSVLSDDVA